MLTLSNYNRVMKNNKPIYFALALLIFFGGWTLIKQFIIKPNLLKSEASYSIATVNYIDPPEFGKRYLHYYFMMGGDSIKGALLFENGFGNVGSRYLVKFSKENPKINELLTDKPAPANATVPGKGWDTPPNW